MSSPTMESNEYTGNPIFQLWAVYCTDLSKSDLINISKASGNKLKNATAFLQPFLDAGIVAESESYFNTFSFFRESVYLSVFYNIFCDFSQIYYIKILIF